MSTAVFERSTVTLGLCKAYIKGVSASEEAVLEFLIDAAKSSADTFLGNDFLDPDDGYTPLPIPLEVDRWVLQQVVRDYELKPQGLQIESVNNLGMVNWSQRDYSEIFAFRNAELML